jgi:predicted enzyme related to lactoylglutathione lyase
MRPFSTFLLLGLVAGLTGCSAPSGIDLSRSGITFADAPLPGKFIWHDLITEDPEAARAFYGEILGWSFESTTSALGTPYVLARTDQRVVAGLVPIDPPADGSNVSRWLGYVSVPDVDAAAVEVAKSGGTVVKGPLDVRLGRVAAVVDPEGAVLGLAQSAVGDPADEANPGPGRVAWMELLAGDPDAAAAFYQALIGYEVVRIERRGGDYIILEASGEPRAGVLRQPAEDGRSAWLTSFGVADLDAAVTRVPQLDGTVILPPSPELREGSLAVITDPSGALLALQQL